jgi:hypothetical protein
MSFWRTLPESMKLIFIGISAIVFFLAVSLLKPPPRQP